jgi:hypothetical protein
MTERFAGTPIENQFALTAWTASKPTTAIAPEHGRITASVNEYETLFAALESLLETFFGGRRQAVYTGKATHVDQLNIGKTSAWIGALCES